MTRDLIRSFDESGYQARVVKIERLAELGDEIETGHEKGFLSEALYDRWLAGFVFVPPENLAGARSLIVVAAREPHVRFTFTYNGNRIPLIVPPTYVHSRETDKRAGDALARVLTPRGYRVAPATVPKKLLAVRSGLAEYGKNNVTYVDGTGSYHRLVAFYSDLPCERDEWRKPTMMELCEGCIACVNACPTDAISAERFLLYADKCVTFHNEESSDVPFPAWLDPSVLDLLVGCLRCQRICPANREIKERVEDGAEFTADETALLLDGTPRDRLPEGMVKKMEESDLFEIFDVLQRNLRVLLEKRDS
jgi:epoxyqueuosine reductase